ncbi:MAG: phage portal protein [Alphaproteobacteria bacterium]|nr:phage portal protein [Alphaproteobacteria bacterium]
MHPHARQAQGSALTASPTIVDAAGLPMRRLSASGAALAAGDTMSQELARWNPALRSADATYLPLRDRVAARVHDIAANNGWASGAMQRYVDQAIGADFRFSWRPDVSALGLDRDWLKINKRVVESRFRAWGADPRRYADAAEHDTLSGMMGLAFRQCFLDGESLGLAQWIERPDFGFATAIQMIDPDRLSNPDGRMDDAELRGGIERNAFGAATHYYIRESHPGDVTGFFGGAVWKRIPRRMAHGRAVVLHHFEKQRAGQSRGVPILTPILERFKMADRMSRTEMQSALVNAIFAATITSPFDQTMGDGVFGETVTGYQQGRLEFAKANPIELDGVRIPRLFPAEELKFHASAGPGAQYAAFEERTLRYFAAAIGQPYEEVAQDWSSTNYSSARAAMLSAWKFLTARRGAFADGFATQIFALWLEEAMDRGYLDLPPGAPGFWDNPAAWCRGKWTGAPRGWVDPTKEAQASQMRMDAGLSTLRDECAEQGQDWEEVLEQRRAELDQIEEYGLPRPGWADGPVGASPDRGADEGSTAHAV